MLDKRARLVLWRKVRRISSGVIPTLQLLVAMHIVIEPSILCGLRTRRAFVNPARQWNNNGIGASAGWFGRVTIFWLTWPRLA
jgi:hypothetical protein